MLRPSFARRHEFWPPTSTFERSISSPLDAHTVEDRTSSKSCTSLTIQVRISLPRACAQAMATCRYISTVAGAHSSPVRQSKVSVLLR